MSTGVVEVQLWLRSVYDSRGDSTCLSNTFTTEDQRAWILVSRAADGFGARSRRCALGFRSLVLLIFHSNL
jgi:hypothetical protein